jgi:sugar/nucleoside kinase (ribokinase family)
VIARVVVIGDVVTDVVARLAEPLTAASDAAAAITTAGGGAGANVACRLAEAGVEVHLVARVGPEPGVGADLERRGVRRHLAVDPRRPTGTVIVLVGADGERSMVTDRGANDALSEADLPPELLAPGGHLHLSGYTLLGEGSRAAGLGGLRRARAAGMTVSVDPASATPLARAGDFVAWTAGADLCLPNRDELRILTGIGDPEGGARRLAASYGAVACTLGRDGAVWSDGDRIVRVPAVPATVVDTTGAGDAFTAGFLAAWLRGAAPAAALAAGTELAAAAIGTVGAR